MYSINQSETVNYSILDKLNVIPISGTRGSSGFGSVRREQIESKTLLIVKAGDHCDLNNESRDFQFCYRMN